MRSVWILVVAGLWILLLFQLAEDPDVRIEQVALPGLPAGTQQTDWQRGAIWNRGQRVGETNFRVAPLATGHAVEQTTRLRLRVLGMQQEVATRTRARLDPAGAIVDLAFEMDSPSGWMRTKLERRASLLRLELEMASQRTRRDVEMAEPIYLPITLRRRIAEHLQTGKRVSGFVFDALAGGAEQLTLRVLGPAADVGTWLVEETYQGVTSELWMRADGTVLRERGPLGLETTLLARDAVLPPSGTEFFDVEAATAIAVEPIPRARTRRSLRLRVDGVALEQLPQAAGQRLEGDCLVIERPRLESIPCLPRGTQSPEGERWLGAEELVQSAAPRIVLLAQEIAGDTPDTLTATRQLVDWVYAYLGKEASIGLPNALAVLDAGQGDCNEHAVLLVALLRAVAIPARPVAGLVYTESKFVYHAWAEVLLGEHWLAVDPAFGQVPADTTHVALAGGDSRDATGLLAIVGRLELRPEP